MEPPHPSAPEPFVEEVLAIDGYRARLRFLHSQQARFTPEVARAFTVRAHAEMRRDPRLAAQVGRFAESVSGRIGDGAGRIDGLRALGQACVLYGRFPAALRALEAAAGLARHRGDEKLVAELETMRIHPLVHLERYTEARNTGERALTLFERLDHRAGAMRVRMALADLEFRLDRPRAALRHYAAVERLADATTSQRFRAVLAANRANALEASHRFRAAQRQFAQARELFRKVGCEHSSAQVDYNEAYADLLRGQYSAALRGYSETEERFLRLGDERHLALIDLERAEIHVHLNLPADAASLATRAEARFDKLGMAKESAQAAELAGRAAALDGRSVEAEDALRRAEARFRRLGHDGRRLACAVQRGDLALARGDAAEARRLAGRARALVDGETSALSSAAVDLLEARLDLAAGNSTAALHRADGVGERCRRIHAPWLQIAVHQLVGRCHALRGDVEESILAYGRAVEALECYRGGVPADEYMSAFLAGRSSLYEEVVELLARHGYAALAFEFTERAKSRALVDLLAGRAGGRRGGRGALTLGRLRHLRESLNSVYQRLFRLDGEGDQRSARAVEHARDQASALEEEIARLLREARLRDDEATSLETVSAPDLAGVREDLEPGTALLEYMVTARGLATFLVTRDSIHVAYREMRPREIDRRLERFRFHLARIDANPQAPVSELALRATRANLEALSALLVVPALEELDVERLVIVPHGALHGLPFHALPVGEDGWLGDRFRIVYAPSASVYRYCGTRAPASGAAAVFGLPDEAAPEIAREARGVAAALGSDRLRLGEEATLERLRADARDARVVHIATHGMFRKEQPMLSSIRLADTWLNLYDLYDLDLGAELVVLSTCESGIADVTGGDEILGLTRGFLFAGARSLLASQWRVHDRTAADLMALFYARFEAGGDAAAALQEAMAEIRSRQPHPYFWAPFFLTGRPARGAVAEVPSPLVEQGVRT